MDKIKNKKNVSKTENAEFRTKFFEEIDRVLIEMKTAQKMFDEVEDENLIEMAIYLENIAKKRYAFLLAFAKNNKMKADNEYIYSHTMTAVEMQE